MPLRNKTISSKLFIEVRITYPAWVPSLQVREELESHTSRRLSGGKLSLAVVNTACYEKQLQH